MSIKNDAHECSLTCLQAFGDILIKARRNTVGRSPLHGDDILSLYHCFTALASAMTVGGAFFYFNF
ncbi:hypothetical protein [Pectobacterium atrosepticum]|uniref:hypothetical protein n=1 Tax=Pectobacterium atrosepticum TaxID=29471 RepID=UPI00030BD6C9|nr:hypothetical protein [Pectobacterium atrosepticum]MCL6318213.1 hypothetical protein [Pectobacterium atrosepticum]MCL6392651.1 hypothetical protein [Pectobacterium atrosepticum]QXE15219.1 hypothetical protein DCX48_12260 [Pectobacterium atrosepticum]